ncbi:MAG: selenium metabolism-associated LysR family transcriptional regulator [Bacillota bacterium]
MNVNQMETFLTVLEKGSFSSAARELHLTQPAISLQIQSLENFFGTQLMVRAGKSIVLTPSGEEVRSAIEEMLATVKRTRASIDRLNQSVQGRLVIAASTIPGEYLLPRMIGEFKLKYPQTQLLLEVDDTQNTVTKVIEQRADLGMIGAEVSDPKLSCLPVAHDELVVIAPPEHPLAGAHRVAPEQLQGANWVARELGSGTRAVTEELLRHIGVDPTELNVLLELGSSQAMISAVAAGVGLAFCSRLAADAALRLGQVAELAVEGSPFIRPLFIVYHRNHFQSRVMTEFLSILRKEGDQNV